VGKSGNGEIAYSSYLNPANNPTAISNGLDGHTTIRFDGTSDYLKDTITIAQPVTYYLVMKQITWTDGDNIIGGGGDATLLRQRTSTPNLSIYSGVGWTANNTDLAVDTWAIVRVVFNGASSSIKINNNIATTGNAGTAGATRFCLGAYVVVSNEGISDYANIEVAEIIICQGTVSAEDDANIMAYLHKRYPSLP